MWVFFFFFFEDIAVTKEYLIWKWIPRFRCVWGKWVCKVIALAWCWEYHDKTTFLVVQCHIAAVMCYYTSKKNCIVWVTVCGCLLWEVAKCCHCQLRVRRMIVLRKSLFKITGVEIIQCFKCWSWSLNYRISAEIMKHFAFIYFPPKELMTVSASCCSLRKSICNLKKGGGGIHDPPLPLFCS